MSNSMKPPKDPNSRNKPELSKLIRANYDQASERPDDLTLFIRLYQLSPYLQITLSTPAMTIIRRILLSSPVSPVESIRPEHLACHSETLLTSWVSTTKSESSYYRINSQATAHKKLAEVV